MQTACVDGSIEITAIWFSRLSIEERARYRGRLSCPDRHCAAPVHFRSRSVDGRPPLFYSNRHAADCSEKSPVTQRDILEAERRADEAIWNEANELVLRLDPATPDRRSSTDGKGSLVPHQGRRHDPQRGERHTHASSIGLRPLLRRLRDDPSFRASTMPLKLSNGRQSTVHQACTHVFHYAHSDRGRIIVWGPIVRAHDGWINSGSRDENRPAVRVREADIEEVLDRAYVGAFSELDPREGSSFHFIVEGVFGETKNGTPWVTIESPDHLALLPDPRADS